VASGIIPHANSEDLMNAVDLDEVGEELPDLDFAALSGGAEAVGAVIAGIKGVVISHDNSPGQSVICGPPTIVETALARLRDAGADVRLVEMHRAPWSPANALALRELRNLIRRERPDVVHGHSSIGGLLARLATMGTRIPTVYTPNGITQSRAGIVVERRLRSRTAMLVAVSASEADLAVQLQLIGRRQVVVIPNGIELEAPAPPLDLRAHFDLPSTAPLVGTIARLVPQKAPEDFVAACATVARLVPEARFVLIGSGELEAEVEAAVRQANLHDRLYRIPALAGAAGVLGQLDVFALSSRFEGGPYSPLEAMRAGTAVVLTAVVGSRDSVEPGVSGLVVPPGEPVALGTAIADLLRDAPRRHAMAVAGQERVASRFDVRRMGAALDALYDELGARRDPPG
jgi:glycosyltransferase involved in cell wall biosynthesis